MAVSSRTLDLIQIAKSWNYQEVSDEEMLKWLNEVCPQICHIEMSISAPINIIRARCEYDYTKASIKYPCNISFPPEPEEYEKHKIKRGRCNVEGKAVFYGVIKDKESNENDVFKVAVKETSKIYHNNTCGFEKEDAVLSTWAVKKTFRALIFVHHEAFASPHSLLAELREKFEIEIENDPQRDDLIEFAKFFSSEFAKNVGSNSDHEYRLSSLFSNLHFTKGLDAILYPSVRGSGDFINIAIRKELADSRSDENALELIQAKILWIQKLGSTLDFVNYMFAKNLGNTTEFVFQKADNFEVELGELFSNYFIENINSVLCVMPNQSTVIES